MSELGIILEIALKLIGILKPAEIDKIKKEIEKKEEENEKTRERLKKALHDGDIPALNSIFSDLFGL